MTHAELAASPDYAALLRGVLSDPRSDLPRLVLADYLDERGDRAGAARAEFIRLQCDLSRRPAATVRGSQDYEAAARRAEQLLRADPEFNGGGDLVAVTRAGPNLLCRPVMRPGHAAASLFSRGFVSGVTLTPGDFLRHAAAMFALHPVTRVTLAGVSPAVVGGAGSDPVARRYYLRRVDLPAAGPPDRYGYDYSAWAQETMGCVSRRVPRRTRDGDAAARQDCGYRTAADAMAALSWDCVCYGRELAGLPRLKWAAVPRPA